MRILYFTRDYTPHDHRFLTSLAQNGQDVFFLRLERRGRQLEDRSLPPTVQQINWRGGQAPFRWKDLPALHFSLRKVLEQVRPDVLHAGPIQTAGFLAALSGFHPLLSMSWGSDLLKDADQSRLYRAITRYTLSRSDALAGDCLAVQEKAAAFGLAQERSFIFPWGIDLQRFSPLETLQTDQDRLAAQTLRARLGWQDKFVLLSLRSWEPIYGVDVVLRGFARAVQQSADLRLLMLGGGSLAPLVQQIIEEHGLREYVYLGGQVNQNELPQMYRSADLYISASHSDGSSVSLMEALGSGLPVLLSDIPTNREWVQPGEQGWLFPDGSDQSLGDGILAARDCAVRRPEQIARMRRSARLLAEQRADWQKNFRVLLKAYDQIAQNSNQRGHK